MTIKFYLNNPRKSGNCLIVLKTWDVKTSNGLPFVFSINEQILPTNWQDGRAKKSFAQSVWLNAILSKYETKALDFMRQTQVESHRLPTAEELKKHLTDFKNQLHGKAEKAAQENTLFGLFDKVVSELKKKATDAQGNTKRGIWEHYAVAKREIETFAQQTRRSTDWSALDADWFSAYQDWLFAKGDNQNTVTGKWKKVKRVLNTAKELGLYDSDQHRRRSLAQSFQKADEIFLTMDELMRIYRLDLSHTTLERTRDKFLLDAFAGGFRFGDLSALTDSKLINLNDRKALKLHTGKTDTAVITPDSWYLAEFLEKYRDNFPKAISNQVFNKNVRKICKLAGITEPTTLRKNIAGKNKEIEKPKYMWASMYTARYSFATNLYLAGVDIKKISTMLGHSKVSTTETYIKAKQLETAMTMSEHSFFTTKPKEKAL